MTYNFETVVNKQEANTLKEMIFNRVRERAAHLNNETQNDVMDLARESFVDIKNPFANIIDEAQEKAQKIETAKNVEHGEKQEAPERSKVKESYSLSHIINNQLSTAEIANNMDTARKELSNNKNFVGALNFLNSKAAVSLLRTRVDKFEALG